MKTIIAGSRTISCDDTLTAIHVAISYHKFDITEVVSGCATGPDTHGATWASRKKIPVKRFPPDWKTYGKIAGRIRNAQMADYADALICVWDGRSSGTKHMLDIAIKRGLKVCLYRTDKKNETIQS